MDARTHRRVMVMYISENKLSTEDFEISGTRKKMVVVPWEEPQINGG
jgi:hypothetical protein